jgi:hypothetical protein
LREAHQRQLMIRQPIALELGVEKSLDQRRDRLHAEPQRVRPAVAQREPLIAEWRHIARVRCIWRDERGTGQQRGHGRRQLDQVLAVGADAVQQHDQLAGRPARARRYARSGQQSQRQPSETSQKSNCRVLANRRRPDNDRRASPTASPAAASGCSNDQGP